MRRWTTGLLFVAVALLWTPAWAGTWERSTSVGANVYVVGLSAPSPDDVFVTGFTFDMSGFPTMNCQVLASSDGGASFTHIDAVFATTPFCTPSALFFLDVQTGWLAVDKDLYWTTNRGGTWTKASVAAKVNAIHFFDANHGVAAGDAGGLYHSADGGHTWTSSISPTLADLSRMFWLDSQRGWAAGQGSRVETDPETQAETEWPIDGVVLRTQDGGLSWEASQTFGELGAGPVFFLNDGRKGWHAAWEKQDEKRNIAHLLTSEDGGATWVDTNADMAVGELNMFMTIPLQASLIQSLFWADAQHGHLGGGAYIAETSSGMGGSSSPIWRVVDLVTIDGGTTWTKTDLGTISIGITGDSPPSDGAVFTGQASGLYSGWMAGEKGSIWKYQHTCLRQDECGAGYLCLISGECVWDDTPDNDVSTPNDVANADGTSGSDGFVNADGSQTADGAETSGGDGSSSGCGCSLRSSAPQFAPFGWLFVALVGLLLSKNKRSHRV